MKTTYLILNYASMPPYLYHFVFINTNTINHYVERKKAFRVLRSCKLCGPPKCFRQQGKISFCSGKMGKQMLF